MHHLAIDDYPWGAHDAIAHDFTQFFNLLDIYCYSLSLSYLLNQRNGALALGAARAQNHQYLDLFHHKSP